jgi:protein TonB
VPLFVNLSEEKKEIVVTDYINNDKPDEKFAHGKLDQKVEEEVKSNLLFRAPATVNAGHGRSSDRLEEDLPLGDISLLNTREFVHWNYYQDIRERIERYWGKSIETLAKSFSNRKVIFSQNMTTLKVVIDSSGKINNVILERPSDISEFDSAAIDAFNRAGPFPNPPSGILKDDRAVIEWRFIVNA